MALRVEPLRNINDVTVDAVDTKECLRFTVVNGGNLVALCAQLAVVFFQDRSLEVLQRILCCVKVSSELDKKAT